jgi:hypothetical protein
MAMFARRRSAAALFFAALIGGFGVSSALAQDYDGSTVTSSGGTAGVDIGDVLVLAPGVTINDGDVSNETGIGVVISGGTSAGASPGGGSNASVNE